MNQLADFFKNLFDSSDWPPRWHCGRWSEFHGWLYIISDLLIWSAYFSIPLVIINYISKRTDIRFIKLYFLFGAFILACGATHFFDAIAFWIPVYRLNALVRFITAMLSWTTVFYLVKLLPVAFSLKSPGELEAEIEQRKIAEAQSRESEEQIQNLFDAAPDAVIIIDEQGQVTKWNPKAAALFGWTEEEVMGKGLNEIIIPYRYREAHKKGLSRFLETGKGAVLGKTIEIQGLTKGGVEFDVALSISPTVVNGKYLFVGFVRDITEQKKVEEEIRQLNTRLEQLVSDRTEKLQKSLKEITDYKYALDESSIVAITDQKGIIRHVNDNFCKISKYAAEELIGQDHRIINSGHHPKEFIRTLWVTIANGEIWKGELRNRAKDGSIYWVDTTIVPFLDEQGKPWQYVAIRADITSRKQVEKELYKQKESLEDSVSLRTIQLEAANKEMEAFTYSVSHDLRAPLRAIIGFTTILEEDYSSKLDAEAGRITSIIKNNTLKMGHLIDDLLAFSRMGKQDLEKTDIDTGALVKEIIVELTPEKGRSPGKDQGRIEWNVQPLLWTNGDLNTIRQVWVNLISNAIKYSGRNPHPHIEIGSFIQGKQTVFFIKDNGVGFDNKYQDKLFKVFQRLHSPDEFEGTGVGLALVSKIVSKHGGMVWAEAEVNKGACFSFSLPSD